MRFSIARTGLTLCLVAFAALAVFADTIRLKDGSLIKGKIVSFDNGRFVVVIGDDTRQRRLTFTADEVASITFEPDTAVADTSGVGETKIITVGQRSSDPPPRPPVSDRNSEPPVRTSTTRAPQPITLEIDVLADETANGWTNTGWVVAKGQRIRITGAGRISLGNGRFAGPAGIATLPDESKLIKTAPTGGLIAVIGDDNNDFIYIGETMEFTASRDGHLFLGVNEGNLGDNSGSFTAKVEIEVR